MCNVFYDFGPSISLQNARNTYIGVLVLLKLQDNRISIKVQLNVAGLKPAAELNLMLFSQGF